MKKNGRNFLNSFRYAFNGLLFAARSQRNMRVHLSVTVLVSYFGFFYRLTAVEWVALGGVITFVIVCEMINTAIENSVDLATREYDERAKAAKDVAAGAVLVASFLAVVVAAFLFLDTARLQSAFDNIFSDVVTMISFTALILTELWWIFSDNTDMTKIDSDNNKQKE